MTTTQADELVADLVTVDVAAGSRALVAGDLHLTSSPTEVSKVGSEELARAVDGWTGSGVVVLNGNLVELLASGVASTDGPGFDGPPPPPPDPVAALDAHPALRDALRRFAGGEGREIVLLIGSHDGRLAWDEEAARRVAAALGGARIGFAAQLVVETARGCRLVRVEPGWRFDPLHAKADPRNPADTPLAHHVVTEIVPGFLAASEEQAPRRWGRRRPATGEQGWLEGIDDLVDPGSFPAFVASRLTYRRLSRLAWWLLVPFVLAFALRLPIALGLLHHHGPGNPWPRRLILIGAGALIDLFLVAAGVVLVSRRTWEGLAAIGNPVRDRNRRAREEARSLVTDDWAGLVTSHTHEPELTVLGEGFHANTGCLHQVLIESETYLSLPAAFLPHRQLSWVELEAGADLHVRLLHARTPMPGATRLERLAAKNPPVTPHHHPDVVASFPPGPSWPPQSDPSARLRRIRRWASAFIALAGVLDLVSALTPPLISSIRVVTDVLPLALPQAAAALVALSGVALLALARGVRRGQRHAWAVACALLAVSVALHVVKGGDIDEALVAVGILAFLLVNRSAFDASFDVPSLYRGLGYLVGGAAAAVVVSTVAIEAVHGPSGRPPFVRVVVGVAERLVGIDSIALHGRAAHFLTPVLFMVGIGLVGFAGVLLARPVVAKVRQTPTGVARAREVVSRYGGDTLSYFALRDDKSHFFWGESLVAYAIIGGICLVSPDPIGPPAERDAVWEAFRAFADGHGWPVAVLGAGEEWLPIYRESGMHDIYMGDEGIVDFTRFRLEGKKNKGLRQAVNRIANYGYTMKFYDPTEMPPGLEAKLRYVLTQSRKGDVERGFSMTLGRIFNPEDKGLLLAVAYGPDGEPCGFCQYVPAADINGYSLDLMRRDKREHPNGLSDFIVVRTIEHLKAQGKNGLGLNFATMRAILSGEAGNGPIIRVERWLFRKMSDTMQIESLWRYNAKFDPDWKPRYAVYDSYEHLVPAALALARAESFWELPVIGRFLVPADTDKDAPVEVEVGVGD